jgi:hypothetical protein
MPLKEFSKAPGLIGRCLLRVPAQHAAIQANTANGTPRVAARCLPGCLKDSRLTESLNDRADGLFAELLIATPIREAWHTKCGSTHTSSVWRAEWVTDYEHPNMRVTAGEDLGNFELEWRRSPNRIQHYKYAWQ